jgi:hypothetical protein
MIGDKVRLRPDNHDRFDDGIWEVYFFNSSNPPPFHLIPYPPNRTDWGPIARTFIRAYQHQLVKLTALDQIVIALEEAEGATKHVAAQ